jgi:hypothetical protein
VLFQEGFFEAALPGGVSPMQTSLSDTALVTALMPGIHHVTAIASDPQQNVDFYTGVLGLCLVKLTVNVDDPGAYHLYYGDEVGHPGTLLTLPPRRGHSSRAPS